MHPFVKTNFPNMDVVVVRENEEDLYAGIEHQQTPDVVQTLKLITRPGSEKIIRYAFEYARAYGRKKVTCMTKDNIMKHTDGLFHKVFDEVKEEYPDIETEHYIIDIGTARLANRPDQFDVVVTLNLYGDILSDITAEISGSVGMGGSANIGESLAMFEAIHGSAPDIAGQKIANPSGLINASCMMLVHMGMGEYADKIQNALFRTIEDGIHTGDLKSEYTKQLVNTMEFADAVIERLGQKAEKIKLSKPSSREINVQIKEQPVMTKKLVGSDLFVDWGEDGRDANIIGKRIDSLNLGKLRLKMITNRGVLVYPNGFEETYCTHHWRCRLVAKDASSYEEGDYELDYKDINYAIEQFCENGLEVIKTENLYLFDGVRSFSLGQGESK
jgi:isocitrate dehydrogenase